MERPKGPAPVINYEVQPPRAPRSDLASVRFTAGAAVVPIALFAIGVRGGDDMACCSAMGLVVEIAMIAGAFNTAARAYRSWCGCVLAERNPITTVGGGATLSGLLLGLMYVLDRSDHANPQRVAMGVALFLFFAAIAASPLWVYRREPVADGGPIADAG